MFDGSESIWENPSLPSQGRLDALPSRTAIRGSAQAQGWTAVKV